MAESLNQKHCLLPTETAKESLSSIPLSYSRLYVGDAVKQFPDGMSNNPSPVITQDLPLEPWNRRFQMEITVPSTPEEDLDELDIMEMATSFPEMLEPLLLQACAAGEKRKVIAILSHNVRLNIVDQDGKSPQYHASRHEHYDIVQLQLKHGADVELLCDVRLMTKIHPFINSPYRSKRLKYWS